MSDGDVFKSDIELACPSHEVCPDPLRYGFSLSDEFGGIELGDDGFEDFVSDGGEDSFVVVKTEVLSVLALFIFGIWLSYLIDHGQPLHLGSVQHPQCQTDHLQILATSCRANISGLRAHIVDDSFLYPRDEEMCAFIDHAFLDTRQTIEDDCSVSASDIVHRCLSDCHSDEDGDRPSRYGVEDGGRSHLE